MERDDLALDGLIRELARAPEGCDDLFVARVLSQARAPNSRRIWLAAAAAILLCAAAMLGVAPAAPTGPIRFSGAACLVPEATHVRLLLKEPATDRLLLLGEVPIDSEPRVPADTPLVLQAVGPGGLALWTSPHPVRVRKAPQGSGLALDAKSARAVEYARDVKPILDQHCVGCHAEGELVQSAVRPFEARHSPLVMQTHAALSDVERRQLALWIDLGAPGRR